MSNLEKVQDLIERAEEYINRHKVFGEKRKSWLTPEEQEENRVAVEKLFKHINDYYKRCR